MASPAEAAQGPILIGIFINLILYGIRCAQAFIYWSTFKKDRISMQLFVGLLLIADTVKVVFDMIYIYDGLVVHFGDDSYIAVANWLFNTDPALNGIIGAIVQAFFAWRVRQLTRNNWAFGAIVFFLMMEGLCGIGTAIACQIIPEFQNFQRFEVIVILWLASAALCDCIVTASLVYHLQTQRQGFSNSDSVIDKIIALTVQTGMITAVWATIDLVLFLTNRNGYHLIFNYNLCNLYSNCLMSTLNARTYFREAVESGRPSMSGHTRNKSSILVEVESQRMVETAKVPRLDNDIGMDTATSDKASSWVEQPSPISPTERVLKEHWAGRRTSFIEP
ncbi:hypothetical protein CONPUDRAFT_74297 [Coniophora puteana RWD-64-598 SS2]|uniref:DUF6534 domain-containing protein n=1 Tax=Coniophora puteana (strain RWD-64-598) TaxID=741705 RepID=A0A5M3MLN6_CONPW|nr:uncharacterized protein CONPUDRAFT_74297 [Coniophora puteana RWD-64-598 SS2]EIW80013.1 hypothetical protein CONPUDRAFT_74297 [Coniophora puteana RWD-64-598 SS2]